MSRSHRLVVPDAALELWQFTAIASGRVDIFPDGCRDLIVRAALNGSPDCFVTGLADGVETADFVSGQSAIGVRLRPGAVFDEQRLVSHLRSRQRYDEPELLAAIAALVTIDLRVAESLSCLAECTRLELAQARLGVSGRTLERLLSGRTGRGPLF